MAHICITCKTIVRPCFVELFKIQNKTTEGFYKDYVPCVQNYCAGQIVEIDDLILPIIKLLWKKGYETKACCSSHPEEANIAGSAGTYILFKHNYMFNEIPEGFEFEVFQHENIYEDCVISKRLTSNADIEAISEIGNNMIQLCRWAEKLPLVSKSK